MKVLSLFIGVFVTLFCNAQTEQEESIDSLRPPTLFGQVAPEYPVLQWINKECKTSNEKLTLLYFWSVRNPMAAYVDIPRFNKFVKEFGDQLNIIGLSPDSPEFITDIEPTLEFPYAYAPEAFTNFGIKIFGYCYILDPQGIVIYEGFPLLEGETITEKLLKKLIRKHYKRK